MNWSATILTLFPEMFPGPLGLSLAGKALREGRWSCEALDIRGFATDRHRTVDDTPFGGGAGMVMRPDVLDAALGAALAQGGDRPAIYLTPRGRPLDQAMVRDFAAGPGLVLLCGRYEGVDERVIAARGLLEVSIGDYVLSGGEVAALVLLDACVRLLPGVMGAAASAEEESFSGGLLEYPHYTRPAEWNGRPVPPVLLSGHHAEVARWRQAEAERITHDRRPDLWARYARANLDRAASPERGNLPDPSLANLDRAASPERGNLPDPSLANLDRAASLGRDNLPDPSFANLDRAASPERGNLPDPTNAVAVTGAMDGRPAAA